jgi:DNA-nicking Smr family endonuclease
MSKSPTRAKKAQPDSDADPLADAMAGVVPLTPDPRGRVRGAPTAPSPPKPTTRATPPVVHEDDADELNGYVAPGVDRRELRKIKRGDYAPGDVLDLHGLTTAEATAKLKLFIDSRRHRHRFVCIIHGRGLHSTGNVAVLKAHVRQFLRRHPAVLGYADAPRTDGGSGAVYVLLRKQV